MTKFTSAEEVGFDRVRSQLRRWVKEIKGKSEANGECLVFFALIHTLQQCRYALSSGCFPTLK